MLTNDQLNALEALANTLTRDQQIYAAGFLQAKAGVGDTPAAASNKPTVNIYYATETGNSKGLALQLLKALKAAGYKGKNTAVNRLKIADIPTNGPAIFLASTHGEGDPPESAVGFFERLSDAGDSLKGLPIAVLGLGDRSYDIFCGAAVSLEEKLKAAGAETFQDIALFDVDYANHTPDWIANTVRNLDARYGAETSTPAVSVAAEPTIRTGLGYSRLEPITGTVKEHVNMNDTGSNKETYHIEIAYEGDITYTPGDAVGIILPEDVHQGDSAPRLYSIASSPSLHEGEVHLTVALATHTDANGTKGFGLASRYLADIQEGDDITFYIHQNQIFNLPRDDQDAIMIGPGTGIAPFRSFVYERSDRAAPGRNWVLFGDQHAHCDFLYQSEWQEHVATETVHDIDLAFSRDQDHKIYVQDKLRAKADQLIEWLDSGAALYVCGAKDPMSRDVEATLLDIIAQKKSLSADGAEAVLAELEEQNRYQKDVY